MHQRNGCSFITRMTVHFDRNTQKKQIRILLDHKIHLRTLLLSLCHCGLLTANDVSSVLGITTAHCRELARRLATQDVVVTLVDQRQGQQQDYLVGAEVKAQIIKHFAALAVTGRSTSGDSLAQSLNEANEISLSARTIRWHMNKLGLNKIKKTLPALVNSLKKLLNILIESGMQLADLPRCADLSACSATSRREIVVALC